MQTDRYTKCILTVIAFGLIANILISFLKPVPALAQGGGRQQPSKQEVEKPWTAVTWSMEDDEDRIAKRMKEGYEPFAAAGNASGYAKIFLRKR